MSRIPFDFKAWQRKLRDNRTTEFILSFAAFCLAVVIIILANALGK